MNTARSLTSVQARFSAAATTYDQQGGVQPHVAHRVADLVGERCPARVLEVGCGTGRLTGLLARRFPRARLTALDLAPGMVAQARGQLGSLAEQVEWRVGDVREHAAASAYPLIVSSSALHWLVPLADGVRHLAALLAPGGSLVAGLMLRGTLHELHGLRAELFPHKPAPVVLPRRAEVVAACRDAGLSLETESVEAVEVEYPSAMAFLRVLRAQGVTGGVAANRAPLQRGELRQLVDAYQRRFAIADGRVRATYEVLYLRAAKA